MSEPARRRTLVALFFLALLVCARPGATRVTFEFPPPNPDTTGSGRPNGMATQAVPEVRGPGHVTTASRVWLKATNIGVMGNAFPSLSSDPSAQWPGSSGVEYLYYWGLWVGGVVPGQVSPEARYRVSSSIEWRPPSLDPVDRIYDTYQGAPGSLRWVDDDHDRRYDEDPLNGKDDDGDGKVDEDGAMISQRMFAFDMRDDTPQALNANPAEPHVPLGLSIHQTVDAFEARELGDFVPATYQVSNVSDHVIDSVYVAFLVDQDVGPVAQSGYWRDDLPEPRIPSATYSEDIPPGDPRYQPGHDGDHVIPDFCDATTYQVLGFTMTDDDGDDGRTAGASCFLLLDHTIDPRGLKAPKRVGFRAFRLYRPGAGFGQGGAPTIDFERYQAMSVPAGVANGAPAEARPPDAQKDDWSTMVSVGPFPRMAPGDTIAVTVALGVWPLDLTQPVDLPGNPNRANPDRYRAVIDGARSAFLFYRGSFEVPPPGTPVPPLPGREARVVAPPDRELNISDCHFNADSTGADKTLQPGEQFWFNFNCDYCDAVAGRVLEHWIVPTSPIAPAVRLTPGDHRVTLAWDNLSETIPDRSQAGLNPDAGQFRFWGYRVYRATGYTRPVGSTGPSDTQWELLASLRRFDALEPLIDSLDVDGDGDFDSTQAIEGVLVDTETGRVYPANPVPPRLDPATGDTLFTYGNRTYFDRACRCNRIATHYREPLYPLGRYGYVDPDVLNGFIYFYAITAVDSSGAAGVDGTPGSLLMREGRRFAVEGDGVVPHAAVARAGDGGVIVVPNPYRGRAAWDLTPSPSDPTGAHVDFMRMPPGPWTLRIFTIAGDLVTTLKSDDLQPNGRPQQESPGDGQASWNLISRNGQDVASGIYLYSVSAPGFTARGKFVIIR